MGKITRQSESSHVTTVVGETGEPEVQSLTDNENTEQVEYDEDGNRLDRDDSAPGEADVEPEPAPEGDGQQALFEGTGEADVVPGDQPPVDKSIADVQTWVGDDYVKAERALEAERNGRNRSSLVLWLEKVAAQR